MKAIQELQVWITDNLRKKLSIAVLADRVAMSVRNFERVFTRDVGRTPSQYVFQARLEAVRQQLERTDRGFKYIAAACGFWERRCDAALLFTFRRSHTQPISRGLGQMNRSENRR